MDQSFTYTPTFTIVTNITSITPREFRVVQIGNMFIVDGVATIAPTATGTPFEFRMSFPTSTTVTQYSANGTCVGQGQVQGTGSAQVTNDVLFTVDYPSGSAASQAANIRLSYRLAGP